MRAEKYRMRSGSAAAGALLLGTAAAATDPLAGRLTDLSLEELSNIAITSVSKRAERLSDAPTSVFVITGDDIRSSGATSLPEALRLAPNLQVARISANDWAISARGLNSSGANKLLVLIDGRSVYIPLFSGVFWDVQDLMMADVERIEVISGPGGTLWGINAVNGVVNVITRSASQTQGLLLDAGVGDRQAQLALRQGGALDGGGHYRVYAKQTRRLHTEAADGRAVNDASYTTQLGFRSDWAPASDKVSIQGDAYSGKRGQPSSGTRREPASVSGANLVAGWERRLANDASLTGQLSYDRVERTAPPIFAETLDIVDLQLQHAWRPNASHALVWGAQYRYAWDRVTNSAAIAFLPARVKLAWASVFAQDEIALSPALRLVLGARVEHNDYTGAEFLPNLRLAWKPAANHLLWSAVSRTVRAPSRLDRDTFVPGQAPYQVAGGPDFRSEVAKVYELGYRGQPTPDASYSVTAFHADYDRLRTLELVPGPTFSSLIANGMRGKVRGLEMWGSYQAAPTWRLRGGFTRLWQDLRLEPGSRDVINSVASTEGSNPARQWMLRSSLDLPHQTEFDVTLRYVSELALPPVPSYRALDLRWTWRPRANIELSVTGQNLLGPAHGEFSAVSTRTAFAPAVVLAFVSRF